MSDLLRDEELLSEVLRRKLLRNAIRAVGVISASSRGKGVAVEDLRAAATLVRLAPRLMLPPPNIPPLFTSPEFWTVERRLMMEVLGEYESREQAASEWRRVFDMNGPREGLFETREEAAAYGRKRFDEYDQNHPGAAAERELERRHNAGERE
jgi:hypothetical protein